jgi:hypothetical protein
MMLCDWKQMPLSVHAFDESGKPVELPVQRLIHPIQQQYLARDTQAIWQFTQWVRFGSIFSNVILVCRQRRLFNSKV